MPTKAEREARRQKSLMAHAARVQRTYGISGEMYWGLYAYQNGKCAICRRATGATRRLAVDHDHAKGCAHAPTTGCPECVRGLLCGPCNRLLGTIKDDPSRLVEYLANPPYRAWRARAS